MKVGTECHRKDVLSNPAHSADSAFAPLRPDYLTEPGELILSRSV